jgi:uncharacterized protein YggU (UPF0235/DUF167 family)
MQLAVTVKPRSKHPEGIERLPDGSFICYTKALPVDGKANAAVLSLVAAYLGVPKNSVRLVRGATSRHKLFQTD